MKSKLRILFSAFGFSLCGSCITAQTGNENLPDFVKQNAENIYQKEKIPGIFIAVLNNGERSYFNAGFAGPDKQLPFDSATIFEIGSITKTFTAYILMCVLNDKGIADTDLIVQYLPDSVKQNKNLSSISFLSLTNHTSGLPRLPGNMNPANARQPYEDYSLADLFSYLKDCSLKPDGKSNYSNLGAGLGGILAERISGKSYYELLAQYIFTPFKMADTGKGITTSPNISQGYFAANDKTDYWNMNVLAPAGELKSTGSNMLNYLQNMCIPGSEKSKMIIDQLTTQTVSLNAIVAVGRGWHILTEKDRPAIYWHNGGTYGFSTFCAFVKDKSKAVVVIVNQFNKNALSDGLGIKIIKKMMSEE